MSPLVVTVCSALLGVLAIGAAGVRRAQRRRDGWPVARGTIVEVNVVEVQQGGAGVEHAAGTHYVGVVRYVYALEPTSAYRAQSPYQGKLESPISPDPAEAYALLEAYPVGRGVEVRYDPARPSRSFLRESGAKPSA